MKVQCSITTVESAISAAQHADPAYEPGRSTSAIKKVELDICEEEVLKATLGPVFERFVDHCLFTDCPRHGKFDPRAAKLYGEFIQPWIDYDRSCVR